MDLELLKYERILQSVEFRINSDNVYNYMKKSESQSNNLRSFLDIANHQLKYINTCSDILSNLSNITTSNNQFGLPSIDDPAIVQDVIKVLNNHCRRILTYFDDFIHGNEDYASGKVEQDYRENAKNIENSIWNVFKIIGQKQEAEIEKINGIPKIELGQILNNEVSYDLRYNNIIADFRYRWWKDVLKPIAILSQVFNETNKSYSESFINTASSLLSGVTYNADKIIKDTDNVLVNEFLQALLLAGIKVSNSVCRDIYNTLVYFNRIPQSIISGHEVRLATNKTIRESYIRQKMFRIIDLSPVLCYAYHRPFKARINDDDLTQE